jgi:outer membrane receptor for ferrienterochelin and colicins
MIRYSTIIQLSVICFLCAVCANTAALAVEGKDETQEGVMEMSLEELMDVEVTSASKKAEPIYEAPSVMTVVSREESELYGDRNLHQLLQRQPSVYTRDDFVYSDNGAGFRGDKSTVAEFHTLVLFNGRPIRESAQGHNVNMYKTFPLTTLDSVELIRGPGSVLYGSNAFTGVVNLKTRIPDNNEFKISAMTGSYGYYESDITAGGKADGLGYISAVRVAGQQGYRYKWTDALGVYGEDDTKQRYFSGAGRLEYNNLSFDFFGSIVDDFAIGVMPFWSNPDHIISNRKLFLNLGYRIPLHERATLELNATHNLQENMLSRPVSPVVGTNTSDLLGEATLFADPLDNLSLVLGWLMEQRSNYSPDGDQYQSIPSYRHEPMSAYAQADYKIGTIIKLIAGTQWNESSYGFNDTISRFGVIITPDKNWGVKLLRGEAFRAPVTLETDLWDPGILVGNKDLEPEQITTYDAQLFYHDEKTYAAATYFQSKINKLIIYDPSAVPTMSHMNGGEQRFWGIEFEGKYFFTPHWHVLGSYMHQENKADAGLNPTVVPENMFKTGMAYAWDGGTVSLFYLHFGKPPEGDYPGMLTVNPDPKAMDFLNFNLDLDFSERLGLSKGQSIFTLRIENLFDEDDYAPTFAYYGTPNSFPFSAGRMWFAGVRLRF